MIHFTAYTIQQNTESTSAVFIIGGNSLSLSLSLQKADYDILYVFYLEDEVQFIGGV